MASPHLRTPGTPSLLELCIKAATRDKSCVKAWRQKRRTFEMLPSELAHELFNSLLQSHLLSATLIGYVFNSFFPALCTKVMFLVYSKNVTSQYLASTGAYEHPSGSQLGISCTILFALLRQLALCYLRDFFCFFVFLS